MKQICSNEKCSKQCFWQSAASQCVPNLHTPSVQPLEHGCLFPTKLAMLTHRFRLRGWFFWVVLIYISGFPSATHLIALSATSCEGTSAQSVSKLLPGINSNSVHRTLGLMHPAFHACPQYLALDSITVHSMDSNKGKWPVLADASHLILSSYVLLQFQESGLGFHPMGLKPLYIQDEF